MRRAAFSSALSCATIRCIFLQKLLCFYISDKPHDCSRHMTAHESSKQLQTAGDLTFSTPQVDEMEGLRKDRDAKRASISALQEEVQLHREQVRCLGARVRVWQSTVLAECASHLLPGSVIDCSKGPTLCEHSDGCYTGQL